MKKEIKLQLLKEVAELNQDLPSMDIDTLVNKPGQTKAPTANQIAIKHLSNLVTSYKTHYRDLHTHSALFQKDVTDETELIENFIKDLTNLIKKLSKLQ